MAEIHNMHKDEWCNIVINCQVSFNPECTHKENICHPQTHKLLYSNVTCESDIASNLTPYAISMSSTHNFIMLMEINNN